MIDALQKYNRKERRVLISSHLVPGHLDASGTRKKFLHEPVPNLEFVRTLLIDNYDSYTYNIFQELSIINGSKLSLSYIVYEFSHITLTINSIASKNLNYQFTRPVIASLS